METDYELYEPSPLELEEAESRAYDNAIQNLDEILMFEKYRHENGDYLKELAEEAYFCFVTIYSKSPKNKKFVFIDSVISVLPPISNLHRDKGELMRMMIKEISSRLSKMLWENRREKEARRIRNLKKRTPYSVIKERRIAGLARANDVVLHGTSHGELILEGITPKNPRLRQKCKTPNVWKKRRPIPQDERLGSLVDQAETEESRMSFKKAYGYSP